MSRRNGFQSSSKGGAQRGFTLLETMIAIVVLTVGILSLAYILGSSLVFMQMSQNEFICQQKAAEAIESVYTARDTGLITWVQIDNVSNGGIFLDGPQPLLDPGPDGMVNTADDNPALPDSILQPGPDGIVGTADDQDMVLSNFTRQIQFQNNLFGNPNLKQVIVTVTYTTGPLQRSYVLTAYISAFS